MSNDNEHWLTEAVGRQAYLVKHCWDDPAAREEYNEIERQIRGDEPEPDLPDFRSAVERVANYLSDEIEDMTLRDDPDERKNHIGSAVLALQQWLNAKLV